MTKEHVLGDWTRKYLPSRGRYTSIVSDSDGRRREFATTTLADGMQAHILCGSNVRLSALEDKWDAFIGPMMRPKHDEKFEIRLSPSDQRLIATWAAKVSLFWPYIAEPPGEARRNHLAEFHRSMRPPRSFAVWLGT